MPYRDLREYLAALDQAGKLRHIAKEVDKDWEVAAVCRTVFQRIPAAQRPALFFENIKGYSIPIVAGVLGASRAIYALALETSSEGIADKWLKAQRNPIEPVLVANGPCKENVLLGEAVDLRKLPVPVWTVEHDPAPFLTSPFIITKDPETGIRNVGTYRVQLKGRNRLGVMINFHQHGRRHIEMNDARGAPTPVAIVLGTDPTIGLASVSKVPYGVDELAVAGGLRGEPVPVVKCETVDLEVPATAEIVIEGLIPSGYREEEGPFGEYTGYMGPAGKAPVIEVTCITHRDNPIYQAFISQMPPSESSCIRGIGREMAILKHLKEDLRLPVKDVHLTESGGSASILAISLRKEGEGQVMQAMWGAWAVDPALGKITIVVDDDIDIRDEFALAWAVAFRVQPEKDIQVVRNTAAIRLDPSQAPADEPGLTRARAVSSKLAIDATKKHAFPPVALPPRAHLEAVLARWEEYGF